MTPSAFLTRWELEAPAAEVFAILADAESLPLWWPSVFLHTRRLAAGEDSGSGRVVEAVTAGFVPWPLRWTYRTTLVEPASRLGVEVSGDVTGLGLWALEPFDKRVVVRFRFLGGLSGPLDRHLPTVARPLFHRSYGWAMERGFTSLLLEVWRRRTNDASAREWLPKAPRPPWPNMLWRWYCKARRRA